MECAHTYFTVVILNAIVPDFHRRLPVDLWSQERRLNVDHRFPYGPRCVPAIRGQTASKFQGFPEKLKINLKR